MTIFLQARSQLHLATSGDTDAASDALLGFNHRSANSFHLFLQCFRVRVLCHKAPSSNKVTCSTAHQPSSTFNSAGPMMFNTLATLSGQGSGERPLDAEAHGARRYALGQRQPGRFRGLCHRAFYRDARALQFLTVGLRYLPPPPRSMFSPFVRKALGAGMRSSASSQSP